MRLDWKYTGSSNSRGQKSTKQNNNKKEENCTNWSCLNQKSTKQNNNKTELYKLVLFEHNSSLKSTQLYKLVLFEHNR